PQPARDRAIAEIRATNTHVGTPTWRISIFPRGLTMSSHNQRSPTQIRDDGQQMNWKTALRIASVMAEANERLFRLQSEAANAAFTENTKHLKALLSAQSTKDSSVLL